MSKNNMCSPRVNSWAAHNKNRANYDKSIKFGRVVLLRCPINFGSGATKNSRMATCFQDGHQKKYKNLFFFCVTLDVVL